MNNLEAAEFIRSETRSGSEIVASSELSQAMRMEEDYFKRLREFDVLIRRVMYSGEAIWAGHLNWLMRKVKKYRVDPVSVLYAYFEQKGVCKICSNEYGDDLHLDHCHSTGKFRAFLCAGCNNAVGQYEKKRTRGDNKKVREYLDAHR